MTVADFELGGGSLELQCRQTALNPATPLDLIILSTQKRVLLDTSSNAAMEDPSARQGINDARGVQCAHDLDIGRLRFGLVVSCFTAPGITVILQFHNASVKLSAILHVPALVVLSLSLHKTTNAA